MFNALDSNKNGVLEIDEILDALNELQDGHDNMLVFQVLAKLKEQGLKDVDFETFEEAFNLNINEPNVDERELCYREITNGAP